MAPSQTSTASDGVMPEALEAGLGSADQLVDVFGERPAETKSEADVDPSVTLHYTHESNADLAEEQDVSDEAAARHNQSQVAVDEHVGALEQHSSDDRIDADGREGAEEDQDMETHGADQAQVVADQHHVVADDADVAGDHMVADEDVDANDQVPTQDQIDADEPIATDERGTIEEQAAAVEHVGSREHVVSDDHVAAEQIGAEGEQPVQGDEHVQAHQIASDNQMDQLAVDMQVGDEHVAANARVVNEEHISEQVQVNLDSAAESEPVAQEQHSSANEHTIRGEAERVEDDITADDAVTTREAATEERGDNATDALADSDNEKQKDGTIEDLNLKPTEAQITSATAAASAAALAAAVVTSTAAATTVAAMPVAPGLPPGATGYPFPALGPNGTLMAPPIVSVPLPVGRRAVRIAPLGVLPLPPPQGGTSLVSEVPPRVAEIGEVAKGKRRGIASSAVVGAAVLSGEGLTAEERTKQKRMLRNRESAARSRDKRKSRNMKLEQSIQQHQKKRQKLDVEIESLGKIVEVMKQILEKHNIPVPG